MLSFYRRPPSVFSVRPYAPVTVKRRPHVVRDAQQQQQQRSQQELNDAVEALVARVEALEKNQKDLTNILRINGEHQEYMLEQHDAKADMKAVRELLKLHTDSQSRKLCSSERSSRDQQEWKRKHDLDMLKSLLKHEIWMAEARMKDKQWHLEQHLKDKQWHLEQQNKKLESDLKHQIWMAESQMKDKQWHLEQRVNNMRWWCWWLCWCGWLCLNSMWHM